MIYCVSQGISYLGTRLKKGISSNLGQTHERFKHIDPRAHHLPPKGHRMKRSKLVDRLYPRRPKLLPYVYLLFISKTKFTVPDIQPSATAQTQACDHPGPTYRAAGNSHHHCKPAACTRTMFCFSASKQAGKIRAGSLGNLRGLAAGRWLAVRACVCGSPRRRLQRRAIGRGACICV